MHILKAKRLFFVFHSWKENSLEEGVAVENNNGITHTDNNQCCTSV